MQPLMRTFLKDRDAAFSSMDKKKILAYCNKYGIDVPKDEEKFWAGVHKAVCSLFLNPDSIITITQYNNSYNWLKEHGYDVRLIK